MCTGRCRLSGSRRIVRNAQKLKLMPILLQVENGFSLTADASRRVEAQGTALEVVQRVSLVAPSHFLRPRKSHRCLLRRPESTVAMIPGGRPCDFVSSSRRGSGRAFRRYHFARKALGTGAFASSHAGRRLAREGTLCLAARRCIVSQESAGQRVCRAKSLPAPRPPVPPGGFCLCAREVNVAGLLVGQGKLFLGN